MKSTRKIVVALLLVLTMMMGAFAVSSSAVNMTGEETLYLTPGSNWRSDNARFAVYFFNNTTNTNTWASMTDSDGDGVYEVTVPAGDWENLIFCRMNPNDTANNWNNKWNQTADLAYDGTNNHYINSDTAWDNGSGSWTVFGSGVTPTPTPTPSGATYTVAGDSADVFGPPWTPSNAANDMDYNEETGVYTKIYVGVKAGTYKFKCVLNHAWTTAYGDPNSGDPDGNYIYNVAEDDSHLVITLNGTTVSATSHKADLVVTTTATCTDDGETTTVCNLCDYRDVKEGVSKTGHNYVDGVCLNCHEAEPEEHVHVYAWEITTEASCTAPGLKTFTCPAPCGDTYTEEIPQLSHNYVGGFCSLCDGKDPTYAPDYYLVGWINGGAYGCEGDVDNIGIYKIINGEISVFFNADSYVFVKTGDNLNFYMAKAYVEDGNGATLYTTNNGANEKVFVPGGVAVRISVVVNDDNTLTLTYEADDPYYTVAGDALLCGSEWDPTDTDNDMEFDEADGTYVLTYVDVLAGEYAIKVVRNHDWSAGSFGVPVEGAEAANLPIVVEENGSLVCIVFNPATQTVTVEITPPDPEDEPGNQPGDEPGNQPGDQPGDEPGDEPGEDQPAKELNFFQKIWQAILNFFKNLFGKK